MATTYLDSILALHRDRMARDERDWRARIDEVRYEGPSLLQSLRAPSPCVKVIAEVKRRSPSKGVLNATLDVVELARSYERGGASAISVLTDQPHFGGSRDDLTAAHSSVGLPILRKDFTVGPNDVLDAAAMGAAGVLLIVAALSDQELRDLLALAARCGIDAVVEVHDEPEARRALAAGSAIIGVNQRDLRTFEVDVDRAVAVATGLPHDVVTIAESGLSNVADVRRVALAGFDAVLVGEAFVRSSDPETRVRSFAGVSKANRA